MNIFLVPVGSHGDVHPFLGIGQTLLARGHRVTMFTNGLFEPLARAVGMDFVEIGTADQFQQIISDPDLWHPKRGWKKVFESMSELMPIQYDALAERVMPGETIIVAATLAFGARSLQDKTGVPLATVHLQPSIVRSAYAPPKLPGVPSLEWAPPWLIRAIYAGVEKFMLDPAIGKTLNPFRASKGLPPVRKITSEWWNSPTLAIGLFPEWFAKPQADWPSQLKLTGFPLFDEKGIKPLPAKLQKFLGGAVPETQGPLSSRAERGISSSETVRQRDPSEYLGMTSRAGGMPSRERPGTTLRDKPIAFTPGSAMFHGREFFQASADACVKLNRRGILLTRHLENIPENLPKSVVHVSYAPFSELLPHCAALVHHGGIGTTAQAMSIGTPQLIMPMSHDQPDNADRLKKLGVGDAISVKGYRPTAVAQKLRGLIESDEVAKRCADVASRFIGASPLDQTCDLIESLAPAAARSVR